MAIDLEENKGTMVAGYQAADILRFRWVKDNRLLFNLTDKKTGPGGNS